MRFHHMHSSPSSSFFAPTRITSNLRWERGWLMIPNFNETTVCWSSPRLGDAHCHAPLPSLRPIILVQHLARHHACCYSIFPRPSLQCATSRAGTRGLKEWRTPCSRSCCRLPEFLRYPPRGLPFSPLPIQSRLCRFSECTPPHLLAAVHPLLLVLAGFRGLFTHPSDLLSQPPPHARAQITTTQGCSSNASQNDNDEDGAYSSLHPA